MSEASASKTIKEWGLDVGESVVVDQLDAKKLSNPLLNQMFVESVQMQGEGSPETSIQKSRLDRVKNMQRSSSIKPIIGKRI